MHTYKESKMNKKTITPKRVKEIIREEISLFYSKNRSLNENESHKAALDHASAAAKCLDAIEKYIEVVSPKAQTELGDAFETITKILKRVIASPMNYVDQVKAGSQGDLVSGEDNKNQNNQQDKSQNKQTKVVKQPANKNDSQPKKSNSNLGVLAYYHNKPGLNRRGAWQKRKKHKLIFFSV